MFGFLKKTVSGTISLGLMDVTYWDDDYSSFISQDEIEFFKDELLQNYSDEWIIAEHQPDPYDDIFLVVTSRKHQYYWEIHDYGVRVVNVPWYLYFPVCFKVSNLASGLRSKYMKSLRSRVKRAMNQMNRNFKQLEERIKVHYGQPQPNESTYKE